MRRAPAAATPPAFSRGGAFGLAQDEPTLSKILRWIVARGVKGVVAVGLLLYVAVLCVFFLSGSGSASTLEAQRIGATTHRLTASDRSTGTATKSPAATVPPEELVWVNKLLGATNLDNELASQPHVVRSTSPPPASGVPETPALAAPRTSHAAQPKRLIAASKPKASDATEQKQTKQDEVMAAVISAALAPLTDKSRAEWTVGDHAKELKRLEILRDTAQSEVTRLQTILDSAKRLYATEAAAYESILAMRALDFRKASPKRIRPNLTCLGWKQTSECGPYGAREPSSDKACNQLLTGGVSGYCELEDADTNEHFRVMQLNCSSVRPHVSFSCTNAADFANFGVLSQEIFEAASEKPVEELQGYRGSGNGIVIVVYPKLMTSAYATIRALRSYNCTLPIELWVLESEMARNPKKTAILRLIQDSYGPVHVKTIKDPTITGFTTKIHAIYHSDFANVLFLDADNVPVRDPTFLFSSSEFERSSAVFWPDFWHPRNTIFNIHELSLLWELVDMEFVDMFEQESGQILINRRKSAVAMEVLQFYAFHRPNHFDRLILAHGDKDLFRLAWLKAKTDFYMMPFPPGAAGTVREAKFCGMTMVQYDFNGDVLFLHRNAKKLNGRVSQLDEMYWTHLQTFDWNYREPSPPRRRLDEAGAESDGTEHVEAARRLETAPALFSSASSAMPMKYEDVKRWYTVGIQSSAPLFREFQSCYGAEPVAFPYFNLTNWSDLPFADIEKHIVEYAHEAAVLTSGNS